MISVAGLIGSPKFTMTFRNAARGFAVLSAKDGKEAFLAALHDGDLVIRGDFVEVMWFQGLTEYLQPKVKAVETSVTHHSADRFSLRSKLTRTET